jgi:hypothetical protein
MTMQKGDRYIRGERTWEILAVEGTRIVYRCRGGALGEVRGLVGRNAFEQTVEGATYMPVEEEC